MQTELQDYLIQQQNYLNRVVVEQILATIYVTNRKVFTKLFSKKLLKALDFSDVYYEDSVSDLAEFIMNSYASTAALKFMVPTITKSVFTYADKSMLTNKDFVIHLITLRAKLCS